MHPPPPDADRPFTERYGAWALIAGGSDGLGGAFARDLAGRGMNLVLVARRHAPLEALATDLRATYAIEVRTLSLDLGASDATTRLWDETAALDLGLVVFNAGAESSGAMFVEQPFAEWAAILQRNIVTLAEALHRFGQRFAERGRGGLLIVGSEGAFGGGARSAVYTATKGFALNLGESLWAELQPRGVDVLTLLFKIADTPTLRAVLARKDIPVEAVGASATDTIARAALEALPNGPMFNFDEDAPGDPLTSAAIRRERVLRTSALLEGFYAPRA